MHWFVYVLVVAYIFTPGLVRVHTIKYSLYTRGSIWNSVIAKEKEFFCFAQRNFKVVYELYFHIIMALPHFDHPVKLALPHFDHPVKSTAYFRQSVVTASRRPPPTTFDEDPHIYIVANHLLIAPGLLVNNYIIYKLQMIM